jgi:OH-DDVA oxygenase
LPKSDKQEAILANITFGVGTSHGPLLMLAPENWDIRTASDKVFPGHPFQGQVYKYDELLALRRNNYLADMNALATRQAHYDRCQVQLDRLGERLRAEAPDALVILGDDHKEWFLNDAMPAITVFCGDEVVNRGVKGSQHISDSIGEVSRRRHLSEDAVYPCASDLAFKIVEQAIADEFDVATSTVIPKEADGAPKCLGHAYTFIVRRLLQDKPIPMVPIIVNTYYPPNQPSAKRCWNFGRSIGRAVKGWGKDAKIAVIASGGLSHFAIDEDFDQRVIAALMAGDGAALAREPESLFQSGSSESKCWIMAAGALAETELKMDLLDYVPCYRSEAGTGNAMAFATWQ